MENKKTIVMGVTGGIAAFKAAQLTSNFIKKGYDVEVIMTKHATEFIAPLTFESLTKHNVMVSTFEKVQERSVKHISIAQRADAFVVVPATANVIAKIAHGLADDMLTTTFLAASCPKIICPAMNTGMYENIVTQQNLDLLRSYGYTLVEPESGFLACGDMGKGRLADISIIEDAVEMTLVKEKPLLGKQVLISAGPTQEALDPVRFLTNHSSGKMGVALAWWAKAMGADVTLVHGPIHERIPYGIKSIPIKSACEMFSVFQEFSQDADIIIKAAAVGDYRPAQTANDKIKKNEEQFALPLMKNPDILSWLGEHKKTNQVLCGFAMETQNLLQNAEKKRKEKHCDMLVANNLLTKGAGFGSDTNVITILSNQEIKEYPCMSKLEASDHIWQHILAIMEQKGESLC